ncbi:hypothetical protein K438DRAFT_463134 [Mycena galopus ATCC 62051]|nr:hypothetical protein K438DRAFT_463134 [Mycena galopus ATCC 62051]
MESACLLALSVLNIPELLDHTIDFLSESRADLLSSALVSKSWVPSAQSHLFAKITLPEDTKLMKMLEASPHLGHFIRCLSVSLNIHMLRDVVGLALPRLEELSVQCTDDHHVHLETGFLVQSLLRLPTIRHVVLGGLFSSIGVIHTYFDNCSQVIQRV